MDTLPEHFNTVTFKAVSPDDTVRLYLTGGGALHIEFVRDFLDRHTDSSLSKQLSHVCTSMLRKQRTAVPPEGGAVCDRPAQQRSMPPATAEPSITALGRSPRAVVTARRIPGDIFDIKVRKGTLGRYNVEQLSVELHRALLEVSADYRLQQTAAHDDHEWWPPLSVTVSTSFGP